MSKFVKAWREFANEKQKTSQTIESDNIDLLIESVQQELIDEGVRDIGLPEVIIDQIENQLPKVSEKAKTWMGHQWKETSLHNLPNWATPAELAPQDPTRTSIPPRAGEFFREHEFGEEFDREIGNQNRTIQLFSIRMLDILASYTNKDAWPSTAGPAKQPDKKSELDPATKSKRVLQVIQNLVYADGVVTRKPMGQWPRAFKKALNNLSILGVPSEVVEQVKEQFHFLFVTTFAQFSRTYDDVFMLLNVDSTNFEYIKSDNIDEASTQAREYLSQLEEPGQIVHTFDDGSYWYDLQAASCSVEAERMGHCGEGDYSNTLFSLRKKEKRQKHSKSYVTVEYGGESETI